MSEQVGMKMWSECWSCSACTNGRYQTPPMMGVFHGNQVLVVAQNPGIMVPSDSMFDLWGRDVNANWEAGLKMYEADFKASFAAKRGITSLLGEKWLEWCDYTNAVRCRTMSNHTPDAGMISTCKHFTAALIPNYRGIIFVGAIARDQLGLLTRQLEIGRGLSGRVYLSLPHYAAREINFFEVHRRVDAFLEVVATISKEENENE